MRELQSPDGFLISSMSTQIYVVRLIYATILPSSFFISKPLYNFISALIIHITSITDHDGHVTLDYIDQLDPVGYLLLLAQVQFISL